MSNMNNMNMNQGMMQMNNMNSMNMNQNMNQGMMQMNQMNNMNYNPNMNQGMMQMNNMNNMNMNQNMGQMMMPMNQMNNMNMNQMNMMNNLSLMNQMSNPQCQNMMNNLPQNQIQAINVFFRVRDGGGQAPTMILCFPNDKVENIIKKYREKTSDKDESKIFLFNEKPLNPNITVSDAELTNNSNIFIVKEKIEEENGEEKGEGNEGENE